MKSKVTEAGKSAAKWTIGAITETSVGRSTKRPVVSHPMAARRVASAAHARQPPTIRHTARRIAPGARAYSAECLRPARWRRPSTYWTRPAVMPTAAAEKPQCQPSCSPSQPVTSGPAKAPMLMAV